MITRDFSVISNDVTGVSLSLYYYSQKSLTHNIGSASALPIIPNSSSNNNYMYNIPTALYYHAITDNPAKKRMQQEGRRHIKKIMLRQGEL